MLPLFVISKERPVLLFCANVLEPGSELHMLEYDWRLTVQWFTQPMTNRLFLHKNCFMH